MHDYLEIGEIINAHGIRGEVRVLPLTDDATRYDSLKKVYYKTNIMTEKEIESVRYHNRFVIIKFKGIDDREQAQNCIGAFLLVSRKDAVKLPSDSYFICDIIGCKVYEHEKLLGTITDIIQTGSNDVYVVKREEKEDLLIPALKSVITGVYPDKYKVTVLLPEGLIDNEI